MRPLGVSTRPNTQCQIDDCDRMASAKGMCGPHRKQFLKGDMPGYIRGTNEVCVVGGCERPVTSKGLCQTHARYRSRGSELKPIQEPTFRYVYGDGYVRLKDPEHINSTKNGMVLEHVKMMADHLGRRIRTEMGETVHHVNGVKGDNRLKNLELWVSSQPKGQRVTDLLDWAHEIIDTYDDEAASLLNLGSVGSK